MTTSDDLTAALSATTLAAAAPDTTAPQETPNTYRWATVTVASPLQIQLDGDGLPLPLVPESLMPGDPPVGARVWVQLFGLRVIVLGTSGTGSGESPVGSIIQYAGATAPPGWVLCDGTAISRTAFAALFLVIGTTFGAGNGTTTFNVPDLRDRVALTKGPTNATLAAAGGAATVTLSTANLPAHDHSSAGSHDHDAVADHTHNTIGTHTHTITQWTTADRSKTANLFDTMIPVPAGTDTTSAGGGHTHSGDGGHQHSADGVHTHASVGSGTAVSVLQPFRVVNSIIRVS